LLDISGGKARTPAYIQFIAEESRVSQFALFANIFLAAMPYLLDRVSELDQDLADWVSRVSKEKPFENNQAAFRQFWMGLVVSRSVDNFHTYISQVLFSVFRIRPETLRSGSKVEVREVLECASIEEFASRFAERKVEELSHKGFPAMQRYLVRQIGVELEFEQEDLRLASEATSIRNIIVHNGGYANERFLRETGREDLRVGDEVKLTLDSVQRCTNSLKSIGETIDIGLLRKFGVPLILSDTQARPSPEDPMPPQATP
jgi:hypothetical protein